MIRCYLDYAEDAVSMITAPKAVWQCGVLWPREPLEYNGAQKANTGENASPHPYDQEVQIRGLFPWLRRRGWSLIGSQAFQWGISGLLP